ncbi:hypothetical protein UFOVP453_41 [uncultured Caudovirales phage]|uniref:Uncharacterized protein n=1 Tax=uncultured Caudovirales phage TaxID=2100421 RepID=A0A6J5MGL3_9CAUD|nr:hypothetical protein UFOVP453_41 [uncultured Caudovirales phage]
MNAIRIYKGVAILKCDKNGYFAELHTYTHTRTLSEMKNAITEYVESI